MEKKVLFQRMKGLLALVLAFTMMFGTGMMVLADEAKIDFEKINVGDNIPGGTTLFHSYRHSGDIVVYIYDDKNEDKIEEDFKKQTKPPFPGPKYCVETLEDSVLHGGDVSVTLPDRYTYSVKEAKDKNTFWMVRYPLKSNEEVQPVQPVQPVASHEHSFQWVETLEATLESDGLMQHRCECGAVDDEYPISASLVYFHEYCAVIRNAPQNAVVEWNSDPFRCYTRRMMEELAKRPDVSLKTTFTDTDGRRKSFTIPAGQAPADSELFYGFTYLGNLYGWN
ncbi:putative uncharacterized protein [Firmicutes bacterium CAG:95]|nr:putative uncharacterized protein [Firmicutes bacterium CAG:95]